MGEPNLRQLKKELELWQDLCPMLKDVGAVTEDDLKAAASKRDTAGQRLLAGIRAWGDALVKLRGVKPPIPDPVMLGLITQVLPGVLVSWPARGEVLQQNELVVKQAKALAEEIIKQCSRSA